MSREESLDYEYPDDHFLFKISWWNWFLWNARMYFWMHATIHLTVDDSVWHIRYVISNRTCRHLHEYQARCPHLYWYPMAEALVALEPRSSSLISDHWHTRNRRSMSRISASVLSFCSGQRSKKSQSATAYKWLLSKLWLVSRKYNRGFDATQGRIRRETPARVFLESYLYQFQNLLN